MRYFFSSGEASGEFAAVLLAQTIRRIDPQAEFEGIGSQRMRDAGFTVRHDTSGWASFGPFSAVPRIPRLAAAGIGTARALAREKPDAVVLVDFGAFNLRLAALARRLGYLGPIVDVFPPGAWLDSARTARRVSRLAIPLSAFAHQRDFYNSLGLPVAYFGHPLAPQYEQRAPRPPAPAGGGTVALLPGSRPAELRNHVPLLLDALAALREQRPGVRAIAGAAGPDAREQIEAQARQREIMIEIVEGARAAIAGADAAWVASGTAVLECALTGVPAIAFYVVSAALARYVRRVYAGRYYTLPNLVLGRDVVPELMQDRATPAALAEAMDALLAAPQQQYADFAALRTALGPSDALERCAAFIVATARRRDAL